MTAESIESVNLVLSRRVYILQNIPYRWYTFSTTWWLVGLSFKEQFLTTNTKTDEYKKMRNTEVTWRVFKSVAPEVPDPEIISGN